MEITSILGLAKVHFEGFMVPSRTVYQVTDRVNNLNSGFYS
jgi:hypothetical protein